MPRASDSRRGWASCSWIATYNARCSSVSSTHSGGISTFSGRSRATSSLRRRSKKGLTRCPSRSAAARLPPTMGSSKVRRNVPYLPR